MEENKENVVEETTQETTEQVEETPQVDETKFESTGDDGVIKVDLNKPPTPKEEVVEDKTTTDEIVTEVRKRSINATTKHASSGTSSIPSTTSCGSN